MDRVVIRTKLHAVIVLRMFNSGMIAPGAKLIVVSHGQADSGADDVRPFLPGLRQYASQVNTWSRDRMGTPGITLLLLRELRATQREGSRLFIANLNWFSLGLALKALPGTGIESFDDGSANVQRRPGSYLSTDASDARGVRGWVSRRLFPQGVPAFTRTRIRRHTTIYPGLENVVPQTALQALRIPWNELLPPARRDLMPTGVRRIFLGSVLRELSQLGFPGERLERLAAQARHWAELELPHPREPGPHPRPDWMTGSPAEAVIEHYADQAPVQVAHFNSSAALCFRDDPRISWIDLLEHLDSGFVPSLEAP